MKPFLFLVAFFGVNSYLNADDLMKHLGGVWNVVSDKEINDHPDQYEFYRFRSYSDGKYLSSIGSLSIEFQAKAKAVTLLVQGDQAIITRWSGTFPIYTIAIQTVDPDDQKSYSGELNIEFIGSDQIRFNKGEFDSIPDYGNTPDLIYDLTHAPYYRARKAGNGDL